MPGECSASGAPKCPQVPPQKATARADFDALYLVISAGIVKILPFGSLLDTQLHESSLEKVKSGITILQFTDRVKFLFSVTP